jgi:hypothetical protein
MRRLSTRLALATPLRLDAGELAWPHRLNSVEDSSAAVSSVGFHDDIAICGRVELA